MNDLLTWVNENAGTLGVVIALAVAVVPAAWAFARYLNLRSKELQHDRFRIYHDLVHQLVQPEAAGVPMQLDRQIAIVYEMRHFPEYFDLTSRMFEGLLKSWTAPRYQRLTDEIELAIRFIAARSKRRLPRPTTPPASDAGK